MTTVLAEREPSTITTTAPIAALHFGFDVRRRLDEERVDFLEELIINNDPRARPILVSEIPKREDGKWLVVIDGRHRWQAYMRLGYTQVPVEISTEHDRSEQVYMAVAANLGGAKPPSLDDLRMAIKEMVLSGQSDAWIVKRLGEHLPIKTVRLAVDWVRKNLQEQEIRRAAAFRDANDCSYAVAAEKFKVPVDALKKFVNRSATVNERKLMSLARSVTGLNQTYGNKLAALLKEASEAYEDHQISYDDAIRLQDRIAAYKTRIDLQCKNFVQRLGQPEPVVPSQVKG